MKNSRSIYYSIIVLLVLSGVSALFYNCKSEKEAVAKIYQEQHRPQYHFSPAANWMNDPNGMVYYDGEYHLFYQYYPDATVWGPMHWGHAISTDLVYWEHLPIALYPDSLGYIFSGSAVIDWENTSGLGSGGPPMIAIFTHHEPKGAESGAIDFQYQSIAYSNDKGRSWTKYDGNPVIPNPGIKDFRDPKVIWDDRSQQWVMVFAAYDQVQFWGSKNLLEWTHLSNWGQDHGSHGGVWECPDLFPMQEEDSDSVKWVLLVSINPGAPNGGSGTQYFVGEFNGTDFILDEQFADEVTDEKGVWLDYGTDNYAGVTWSDIPEMDGRRLFIGWMSNWNYAQVVPTEKWRSAMTLPRALTLHNESYGWRVRSLPVSELKDIELSREQLDTGLVEGPIQIPTLTSNGLYKLEISLERAPGTEIVFSNENNETLSLGWDLAERQFYIDRSNSGNTDFHESFGGLHTAPMEYLDNIIDLTIYIDHASVELFADEGRTVMTDVVFPTTPFTEIQLKGKSYPINLISGTLTELKDIWNE